jgi:hypothetical protein
MPVVSRRARIVALLLSAALAASALALKWGNDPYWPGEAVPYEGPPMPADEPTAADPVAWAARWDPHVGLWWQHHSGHTPRTADLPRVHPAPSAASRLLLAAQAGRLQSVDVSSVLTALRRMQVLNGRALHGCLRWYWEEKWPSDHNAAFFTALSLIAIDRCYADQLTPTQRAALREILADLRIFFTREGEERNFEYLNRSLGDVVCAWLTTEIATPEGAAIDADGKLRALMLEAATYWEAHHWGWGEHLSDTYGSVCLDELSLLLLVSRRLPDDVRARYKGLFDELLALDDAFGGQPRVPAIRSYAFAAAPTHSSYRDTVRPPAAPVPPQTTPLMPPELGGVFQHRAPLGATFHELGWHDLAPPRKPPQKDLRIACFGGAIATAHLEDDVRLGSLSRSPVQPTAEHRSWGNAWQSFPVAMWRPAGDWAFLQWESRAKDRVRAHPAADIVTGFRDNALATAKAPLAVGQTFAIQRGGDLIALRVMPVLPAEWDALADRLRVVGAGAQVVASPTTDGPGRLVLRYPQRTLSVHCIPISAGATVSSGVTSGGEGITDWGVRFDRAALKKLRMVVVLWGISIDGPIDAAPDLRPVLTAVGDGRSPEERAVEVRWAWPQRQWHLRIDPRDPLPLRDLNAAPADVAAAPTR